jgi:hypothetical protein
MRALGGLLLGTLLSLSLLWGWERLAGHAAPPAPARGAHVREDGGELRAILIQYTPAASALALPTYVDLMKALPAELPVYVGCATDTDCAGLRAGLQAAGATGLERLRPMVTGVEITTWSRDRFAAKAVPRPSGPPLLEVLAPPAEQTPFEARAGDAVVPFAMGRTLAASTRTSPFAFEGGDLCSTERYLFVDVNLLARNEGRGLAAREALLGALRREFAQEVVMLGDHPGDVPQHHIMMYMTPLGGRRVLVGDVGWGLRLLDADTGGRTLAADRSPEMAARFERAATELASRGFEVVRAPVVPLEGGGAYVTYTNVVLADEGGRKVVYLPRYGIAALDTAGARTYRDLGYDVRPLDVSRIYRLGGSVGCLVNILARG